MNRLNFGHLLILLTFSMGLGASEIKRELKVSIEELEQDNCVETLETLEHALDQLKVSEYQTEIQVEGHESLLHDLWTTKISLHERLRVFHLNGNFNQECSIAARGAFRAIRTSEDYIQDSLLLKNKKTMKFPDNAFEEGNIHVRRHPELSAINLKKDLRSGDIILSRGNAFTSAAIANLGEFDTQFSHMSIVYKDPQNKLWTVEAHIEVGSFVRPLEDHIMDKNLRTMIYRMDDADLAKKAAEFIFNKVKKASDTTGNILYDFGFNKDNSEQMFCSEIVSHAFEQVSQNKVQLPLFRSDLLTRKPRFVKLLGIEAKSSFIPSDIEIDPRFKIVAEWRDANRINDGLQKDAIMHAMFKWNDELDYQMQQGSSKKSFIYRNVAWPLRRVPFLKKYFVKKLPLNMSRKLIGFFGVLESIGELLQKELKLLDDKSRLERGFSMTKSEKSEVLEAVRLKDLTARKKKLHKMYRPENL